MPRGRRKTSYATATPSVVSSPVPAPADTTDIEDSLSGLFLFGQIIDRTRRNIRTRENTTAEIVTYVLQDINGRRYFVDEYSPVEYLNSMNTLRFLST